MKLLYPFLLCLLVLSGYAARAQDHLISLDQVTLDLSSPPLQVVEIIDQRPNKSSIGWVQKGMMNQKRPANFKSGFTTELLSFIQRFETGSAEKLPLVLKIQKLTIWEETLISKEYAHAELALAFYVKRNNSYYYLASASAVTKSTGMDVTGQHDNNLAKVLQSCFDRLAKENLQTLLAAAPALSLQQVLDVTTTAQVSDYPIFNSAPRAGVYASFQQFRDNTPDNQIPLTVKEKGRLDFVAHYTPDNKKVKDAWGFSDGATFYIRHGNDYFPLVQQDSRFVFYGYGAVNTQHVTTAAVLGGAIGGAIAGATSGKAQTIAYTLDMLTGTVQSPENDLNPLAGDDAPAATVTLYRRGKGQLPETVFLTVNDTLTLEINTSSVHTLSFAAPYDDVRLYAKDAKEPILVFTPTPGQNRYIEVNMPQKKGAALTVNVVDEKVGEFYSKEIDLANEKQSRR